MTCGRSGCDSNTSTSYRTLTEHWDGSAWSVVSSPSVGPETNLLFSVDAVSANDIWAVGFYYVAGLGQTLILHWDGSTWGRRSQPGSRHISHTQGGCSRIGERCVGRGVLRR